MKNLLAFLLLVSSAVAAHAGPYSELQIHTSSATDWVSGDVKVAAATTSSKTATITLQGSTGLIQSSSMSVSGNISAGGNLIVTGGYINNTYVSSGTLGAGVIASSIAVGAVGLPQLAATVLSSATMQGNTFNAASKLVQLNGSSQYPALDGSLITNLTPNGVLAYSSALGMMAVSSAYVKNTNAAGDSALGFYTSAGSIAATLGYGNSGGSYSGSTILTTTGATDLNLCINSAGKCIVISGVGAITFAGASITTNGMGAGAVDFSGAGSMKVPGGTNGKTLCQNASGNVSGCTSAVDASGNCTCP